MTAPTVLNGASRNRRLVTASHMDAHPAGTSDAAATAIVSARYTIGPPARSGRMVTECDPDSVGHGSGQPHLYDPSPTPPPEGEGLRSLAPPPLGEGLGRGCFPSKAQNLPIFRPTSAPTGECG